MVKDGDSMEAVYTTVSATTLSASAPTPGNSGILTTSWNGASGLVTWTAATDDVSAQTALQYKVVYSATNSLNSVTGADTGTTITNWSTNISSAAFSGLTAGQTYYFNVLVKDEAGNMSIYNSAVRTLEISSPAMTSSSPERKTFFDSSSSKHWAFWYAGQSIRYGYSSDGTSFTTSGTLTSANSNHFTVSAKNGTVLVVYESGYDIALLRGGISGTTITWESALTALDATSASNAFSRPAATVGNDGHIYVGSFQRNGTDAFSANIAISTTIYTGTLNFNTPLALGAGTSSPSGLAVIAQGSYAMAIFSGPNGATQSYSYNVTVPTPPCTLWRYQDPTFTWEATSPSSVGLPPTTSPSGMAQVGRPWARGWAPPCTRWRCREQISMREATSPPRAG
jgi:hypothetical protein